MFLCARFRGLGWETRYPWTRVTRSCWIPVSAFLDFFNGGFSSIARRAGFFGRVSSVFSLKSVRPSSPFSASTSSGQAAIACYGERVAEEESERNVDSAHGGHREFIITWFADLTQRTKLSRSEQGSLQFPWMQGRPKHRKQSFPGRRVWKNNFWKRVFLQFLCLSMY